MRAKPDGPRYRNLFARVTAYRVAVVVLAALSASAELPATWIRFEAPDGSFSIRMPAKPTAEVHRVNTPWGVSPAYVWGVEEGARVYSVGYSDFPNDFVEKRTPKALLDASAEGILKAVQATRISEELIEYQEFPGHLLRMTLPDGRTATYRIYLIHNRMYHLGGVTPKEESLDKLPYEFLDSFAVLQVKPGYSGGKQ